MSEERVHHPYSPSTLGCLEACPCYEGYQSKTPHERTIAGARAHDAVESGVDDARLSDEDAVAAAECLDFVNRRQQLMEEARTRAIAASKEASEVSGQPATLFNEILELKEVYLSVDDKEFEEIRWVEKEPDPNHVPQWIGKFKAKELVKVKATTAGYVDRVLIDHTRTYAELLDWKFGMWSVEAAECNPQGIAYTLGLFHEYPTLQKVRVWFKQPHIDLISEAVFTRDQIPELYLRVQTIVARARAARAAGDFAAATPMVPACNFCKNIGKCPKVTAFACKVGSKFYPLDIPSDITPTMVLSGPDTTLAMRLSQVLAVWAKSFRSQVTDRVIRGDAPVPSGFKLASGSTGREVVKPDEFRKIALTQLTEAEYASISPVPGFGAVEELVKEKAPRGSKKAAVEDFQKQLMDSGAVVPGNSYIFLRATSEKT